MGYKENREIAVVIPKHYYLELEDIARRHLTDPTTMAAQVLLTFIVNYRKVNSPLITDVHKEVESCQFTPTNALTDTKPI